MKQISALICVVLLMTACTTPFMRDAGLDKPALRKAENDLSLGILAYEDGDYKNSTRLLQGALAAELVLTPDKVAAHKYLAFMYCAQSLKKACRDEFRKALDLSPDFQLTPAEAGHPSWGPVFKSLK